jgi:hypothetical protein
MISHPPLLFLGYAGYTVPFRLFGAERTARSRDLLAHQIGDTMTDPSVRHLGRGPTSVLGRTALHFYETFCEGRVAFNYGFNVANIQKFSLRFLRSDRVLATFDGVARVLALATGQATPVGPVGELISVHASPDGKQGCAVDVGHRTQLFTASGIVELEGTSDLCGFATARQLLLGTRSPGELRLYDTETRRFTPLVARPTLLDMAWSRTGPAWIAAAFADRTLWRRDPRSGATAIATPPGASPPRQLVVSPLVTRLDYDYYDAESKAFTTSPSPLPEKDGQIPLPARLRLHCQLEKWTADTVVRVPAPTAALPAF